MGVKEVYLYKKLKDKAVQCQNCAHYCVISNKARNKVLTEGKVLILPKNRGICQVRENIDGKLFALNYGKAIAVNVDPIEKKPLFHFLPGSYSLSFSAVGCNFRCANCQNWEISQGIRENPQIGVEFPGQNLSPEALVKLTLDKDLPSISYTYTEPTIFSEYALDTMKIAKDRGLKNVWVSNGFMSEESAKMIIPYLDANNIDIKSFSDDFYKKNCGARLQPVLDTAIRMKKSGVWVEITTLAIPAMSDSEEMFKNIAKFIYEELGSETPWHITRFSGEVSWKLQDLPETSVEVLEKAYSIGKSAGLKYVYMGNVPGTSFENTVCPECETLVIGRKNYIVDRQDIKGKCPKCGTNLNIINS
ncbi:MAG: AmmeMemoRadiSam system radical SAM enzyme [Patescibacteria group bacterium]